MMIDLSYLNRDDGHRWAWLGNVAISAAQCVYCKVLRPHTEEGYQELPRCWKNPEEIKKEE
jgi:hypothetical protein